VFKRITEHTGGGNRFRAGVDRALHLRRAFRPFRQQASFEQIEMTLAGLGMAAPDHRILTWRDVPRRLAVGVGFTLRNSRATCSVGKKLA